jgi:hypothetical protein
MQATSHPDTHTGFHAYVVVGKGKSSSVESLLKERIEITARDTAQSLKLKRNNGRCEFPGCVCETGLEWHHHFKSQPAEKRMEENMGGNMYRKISTYIQTENTYAHEAYANQLQKCTLLCTPHHIQTHTHTHTHTHTENSIPNTKTPILKVNSHLQQQRAQVCVCVCVCRCRWGCGVWGSMHACLLYIYAHIYTYTHTHTQEFSLLVQQHGLNVAIRVMRANRKLA